MDLELRTTDEAHTVALGRLLAPLLEPNEVLVLSGDLGAGKTCLVKGIAEGLGVREVVSSPTFNILLVHPGRMPLYHFDLYRLERASQLEDIDFYATLEAGGVSAIEWGDRFPSELPPDRLHVELRVVSDDERVLSLRPMGPRSAALAEAWVAIAEDRR